MNLAATFPSPDVPNPERCKVPKTAENSKLRGIQFRIRNDRFMVGMIALQDLKTIQIIPFII
jgi:hypothetical protein